MANPGNGIYAAISPDDNTSAAPVTPPQDSAKTRLLPASVPADSLRPDLSATSFGRALATPRSPPRLKSDDTAIAEAQTPYPSIPTYVAKIGRVSNPMTAVTIVDKTVQLVPATRRRRSEDRGESLGGDGPPTPVDVIPIPGVNRLGY